MHSSVFFLIASWGGQMFSLKPYGGISLSANWHFSCWHTCGTQSWIKEWNLLIWALLTDFNVLCIYTKKKYIFLKCFIYKLEDKMNCLPTYCFQNSVYKEKEKLMVSFKMSWIWFLLFYSIFNTYICVGILKSQREVSLFLCLLFFAFEECYVEILTVFSVFSKTSRASSKLHFSSIHSLSRFPWTNSSNLPELYLFGRFRILVAFSRSRKTEI